MVGSVACCYMDRECVPSCMAYYFDGVIGTCRRLSALEIMVSNEMVGDEFRYDDEGRPI